MKEELQKKLYKDFPILYQDHSLPMNQTCMCWGFDCEDGWEPLIRKLSKKLETWNKKHSENPIVADQVKSKYRTLHFYFHGGDEKMSNLISAAEYESSMICEICGEPGFGCTTQGNWIWTVCEKHRKEMKLLKMKLRKRDYKEECWHGTTKKAKSLVKGLHTWCSESYHCGEVGDIKRYERMGYRKNEDENRVTYLDMPQFKLEINGILHVFDCIKDIDDKILENSLWEEKDIQKVLKKFK